MTRAKRYQGFTSSDGYTNGARRSQERRVVGVGSDGLQPSDERTTDLLAGGRRGRKVGELILF